MEKYTEVFYWGSDSTGQLGIGDRSIGKVYPSPKCCSFSVQIKKISCGEEHAGFIAANGYLYTMGSNKQGQLGTNNPTQKYASRPVLVDSLVDYQIIDFSCGSCHSGAISTSGVVFTWGSNTYGALGVLDIDFSMLPMKVPLQAVCKSISCGGRHTGVLSEDGCLYMWGSGEAGQLGLGSRAIQKSPVITSLKNVLQVACGVFHTLVLLESYEVFSTGGNSFGQLGLGNKESTCSFVKIPGLSDKDVTKIAAGQHSGCITATGELWIWGTYYFGEFLVPTKLSCSAKQVDLAIGLGYGTSIDRNGIVWSWGSNSTGCLGTGDQESKSQPYPILDLQNKSVTQISCGGNFVIALGKEGENFKQKIEREPRQNNKDLLICLEEMKKEIARLQKGSGGLEELTYKLEQSKIKHNHLQTLCLEEQRQKEHLEIIVQNLAGEKDRIIEKYEGLIKDLEEKKGFVMSLQTLCLEEQRQKEHLEIIVQNLAGEKDRIIEKYEGLIKDLEEKKGFVMSVRNELNQNAGQIEELRRVNEALKRQIDLIQGENKEIPELKAKIKLLEEEVKEKYGELENIKSNSVGIQNHNSVLAQEIKDIPVFLGKITSLETLLADSEKEKNVATQRIHKLIEENAELVRRNKELNDNISKANKGNTELHLKVQELEIEKARSAELSLIIRELENKLTTLDNQNFLKMESLSKDISEMQESAKSSCKEADYYKEIYEETEKIVKKLKNDLKNCHENLEEQKRINKGLEKELNSQSSKNQEILGEIQRELYSRAESYKSLNNSFKTKTNKSFQEDDITQLYGKP
ncbi:hypothetical protein SteCoe_7014 [Stentor coeruleus]|uniref:RCC1-like domain-containing protein n=1 Tax=Stentor coeruleus TaxID=5963 RepID=A0A1R2CNQ4_9CILI|nr:hypothetical protein SteCoe_7014 [Stentor coeruleus]